MAEWLIVSGEPHRPRYDHYQDIDGALVAWDHLKQIRRLEREDRRTLYAPKVHDFLVLICDQREYEKIIKERDHDGQPIKDP